MRSKNHIFFISSFDILILQMINKTAVAKKKNEKKLDDSHEND